MRKNYTQMHVSDIDWLMSEWDWDKNNELGLFPNEVRIYNAPYVWWKCKNGHEWKTKPSERYTRKSDCPFCGDRKVWPGLNDLATKFPNIALDWHPTLNGDLRPNNIIYKSTKKVWWKCHKCGREWEAEVVDRTLHNRGCLNCNAGMGTSFPEQALYFYIKKVYPNAINRYRAPFLNGKELDIYIPELKIGIEYDGKRFHNHNNPEVIQREQRKHHLCEENGVVLIRILEDYNNEEKFIDTFDHAYSLPEADTQNHSLALLISLLLTVELKSISHTAFSPNDFTGYPPIDIDIDKDEYEIRSFMNELSGHSLEKEYPEIAKFWDYTKNGKVKPSMVKPGSGVKYWWICPYCGKSYLRSVLDVVHSGNRGCKQCSMGQNGKDYLSKYINKNGSFAELHPELAKQWHPTKNGGVTPDMLANTSSKKYWWLCPKCGHEWQASTAMRVREHGAGCPVCVGREPHRGVDDLATLYPELLKEWDYSKNTLNPGDLRPQSNKKVWWICSKCKYEWQTVISHRTKYHSGCPRCAGQVAFTGVNDLATLHPELLKEWDYNKNIGIDPTKLKSSSGKKVWWICGQCGHEWQALVCNRTKGKGCIICARQRAGMKRRNLNLSKWQTKESL